MAAKVLFAMLSRIKTHAAAKRAAVEEILALGAPV
jgi:hypothetical protein